jgi:hypothetical protein
VAGSTVEPEQPQQVDTAKQSIPVIKDKPVQTKPVEINGTMDVKMWTDPDSGTEFKLEGGDLYKKTWVKTTLKKLNDEHGIKIQLKFSDEKILAKDLIVEICDWIKMG